MNSFVVVRHRYAPWLIFLELACEMAGQFRQFLRFLIQPPLEEYQSVQILLQPGLLGEAHLV